MNIKRIIGLAGPSGVGKTTVATHLKNMILSEGGGAKIVSFADSMRDMLTAAGLILGDYQSQKNDVLFWDKSYRDILKTLGMAMRNQISKDFWLTITLEKLKTIYEPDPVTIIIDDVRFNNESDAIQVFGSTEQSYVFELSRNGVSYGFSETESGVDNMTKTINGRMQTSRLVAARVLDAVEQHDLGVSNE